MNPGPAAKQRERSKKLCIGLTGRMGSGKGEVVKILQRQGFTYISLSDLVREEAQKSGGDLNREQMQDLGNRMRQAQGPGVLGKLVRERIESAASPSWVIDGIRNPAEVRELRKMKAFYLIGVEADIKIILDRLMARRRDTDRQSEEMLRKSLDREWGSGEPAGGQQVGACMDLADFVVANNSTLAALEQDIKVILTKVGYGHA